MYKKISQQVVVCIGMILIGLSGCTKQPRNLPASVKPTSKGYQVKMAEFSVIFPSDWDGSIAPGINQTNGTLARQRIHASNSRIDIQLRYYNERYGWASYSRWVKDYQRIYRGEDCTIKQSQIGKKYAATMFICRRGSGLAFTILVDGHGSTVVADGAMNSEDDLLTVIEILNSIDINKDE